MYHVREQNRPCTHTGTRIVNHFGRCKCWTLDWTHGLDSGLDHGLRFGLDFGLMRSSITTISSHKLP